MPLSVEQVTTIRAGLDASAYTTGANIVVAANEKMAASGAPVVSQTETTARAFLGVQRQLETYRKATIDGYTEVAKFTQIQENLTRAISLGQITASNANQILSVYRDRLGLVTREAQATAQAIQNVQIKSLAAADAMQRASQAQAAFNARSGSPGTSAPVAGTSYGASAGGGNPLYGDARAGRQADLDAYGAAMDSLRAKYVPMFAAQQQYQSQLAAINEAVANGALSEAEGAAAREKVTQSYLDARDAILAYNIAQRDAAALAGEQQASQAQAAYNARSGALGNNPLYGAARDARQGDIEAAFAGADQQRASVDELYAASKRYEGVLEQIQELQRTGVYNDAQTEAAMARATTAYANQTDMAGSLGIALNKTNQTATAAGGGMHRLGAGSAFATRELIVMGDEVLRGNWTRIPGSMLVLTSHVGVLREALVGLVTSAAGLSLIGGLAVAGGLVAFTIAAESSERQVEALRNKLSLVRGDYVAAGEAAQHAASLMIKATNDSRTDAQAGSSTLYANQSFQGSSADAAAITTTFYDLSKALGETETDWKRMTEALSDPAALLKSLQGEVGGINADLITHVQRLQDAGDKAGAFALVLQKLQDATKHVTDNQTPLQEALRRVDEMFVKADGHGNTLTKTIGGFGDKAATGFVYGVGLMIKSLSDLDDKFNSMNDKIRTFLHIPEGGIFSGGSSDAPAPKGPSGDTPSTGNIPTASANLIYAQAEKLGIDAAAADFATRLAEQETHGHQYNPDGSVQTSSTRALGMMQVEPDDRAHGTTKSINGQTFDLTDEVQNVQASLLMIAASYRQHAGDLKEVAADYVGRGTSVAATAERNTYLNRLHLNGPEPYGPPAPPVGGQVSSDSSHPGTFGVINPAQNVTADALKLTTGTAQAQAEALQDKITLLNKALAQTGNSASDISKLSQELQKAQLEMYNAVPAAEGLYRAVDLQTTAEAKLAGAWTQGAAAAQRLTATTQAETEARTVAAPGTAAYASVVAGLTAKKLALAGATQDVALAQKQSSDSDTLAYLQAETASYAMSDTARVVYLAHVKEEQELKRTAPNADASYRNSILATTDAITRETEALKTMGQTMEGGLINAWKEITQSVNDSGDAFKNLATGALKGAEDAFVKFVETGKFNMHDLLQSIETDLIKLAEKTLIEQPIMNALGAGGPGNLWTNLFGNSFSGTGGTSTGGNVTPGSTSPGSNNGSSLLGSFGSLLGIGKTISGLFSGNAAVASGGLDAATAATSAITSSGQVIGGISSAVPDVYHSGGIVGYGAPTRSVPASTFYGAPRFHDGLNGDEFAAILQKGERVLTQKQDAAVTGVLKSAGSSDGSSSKSGGDTIVHNWNFPPGTDVNSFRRSQAQVTALATRSAQYASQRLGRP